MCVIGRNKEKLLSLFNSTLEKWKDSVYSCDLTKKTDRDKTINQIIKEHWAPDLLINNAAIIWDPMRLDEHSEELIENIIDTNLKWTILFTKNVIEKMKESEHFMKRQIINVLSTAGLYPYPERSIYAATKAWMKHFTESIGLEYKNDLIEINSICPWPVNWETVERVVKDRANKKGISYEEMKKSFSRIVSDDGSLLDKEEFFNAIDMIVKWELSDLYWEIVNNNSMFTWHTLGIDKKWVYDKTNKKIITKNPKLKDLKKKQLIQYDKRRYIVEYNQEKGN